MLQLYRSTSIEDDDFRRGNYVCTFDDATVLTNLCHREKIVTNSGRRAGEGEKEGRRLRCDRNALATWLVYLASPLDLP